MSIQSIGDLAQSFMLRRQMGQLKADLQTLAHEMTTGLRADPVRYMAGDTAPLGAINASLARLGAYANSTAEAETFTTTAQSALGLVDDLATDLAPSLLSAAAIGQSNTINAVAADALGRFHSAVAVLNNRAGDRTLFGGQATDRAALLDSESFLTLLDGVVAGATTADDAAAALDAWFADPTGFATQAYTGGPAFDPLAIAPGETVQITVTAADPALRDTLKALAMAALLDRGSLGSSATERAALARKAGEALMAAQPLRADLSAGLGVVENRIAAAQSRNSAETTALQLARARITAADPLETASRLQETQTQLETIYALTARLSRLSLTDYLR